MPFARRSILVGLLAIPAATAAAAIPETAMPEANCAGGTPASVSPQMSALIARFVELSAALDAVDPDADPMAWDRAAQDRAPALDALVFERPSTPIDFVAKLSALSQFMVEEDAELFVLRRLAEEATVLVGSATK